MIDLDTLLIHIFNWSISPMVFPHLPAFVIGIAFGVYFAVVGFGISQFAGGLFAGLFIGAVAWALYQGTGMSGLASLPAPLYALVTFLHAASVLLSFGLAAAITGYVASIAILCFPERPIYLRSN